MPSEFYNVKKVHDTLEEASVLRAIGTDGDGGDGVFTVHLLLLSHPVNADQA